MSDPLPESKPRRLLRWGRGPLIAVCAAGAIAVLLIATIHPWWIGGNPPPEFTLQSISVTFSGSGAGGVQATEVCFHRCPVTVSAGQKETVSFTVTPDATVSCGSAKYFEVKSVKETTTGGAFAVTSVTADAQSTALPVTIPYPLNGTSCVTTAGIWVTFLVSDVGPSRQSPALVANVLEL